MINGAKMNYSEFSEALTNKGKHHSPPVTSHIGVMAESSTGTPVICSDSGAVIPGKRRTKANNL